MFLSLVVVLGTRATLGGEAFEAWGWRVPFLISVLLLVISVWIRLRLRNPPHSPA
ncbi:MFS family permease OS=Castellaniella defragrans OX=75697 GN=HNR28_002303 PE=4 SV=1 [Castellaniella defragrans]